MYSLFILALVLSNLILIRFLYSCCRKYIKYLSLAIVTSYKEYNIKCLQSQS
ncbi:hypothetical protein 645_0045 [Lactococcus lactis phage 645]|nr:hypothetical protein 645_0045 [Lactococcus lactis phage 645]